MINNKFGIDIPSETKFKRLDRDTNRKIGINNVDSEDEG
jgi:hypothetical protein